MAAAIPEAAGAGAAADAAGTRGAATPARRRPAPVARTEPTLTKRPRGKVPTFPGNPPRAQAERDAREGRRALAAEDAADRATERSSIAERRRARGGADLARPSRPGGARRAASSRIVVVPGTGVTVDDGAGVLLGAFLWALTVAYINPSGAHRGGVAGVRDWLRAKFLNKDASGQEIHAAGGSSSPAPAPSGPLTGQSPGESTLTGPLGQSLGGSLGGAVGSLAGSA